MMTTATKPVTAVQVAAFLKRHLRNVRAWPREKIVPWVTWFFRVDRVLVITDEQDRIRGVALGRFVDAVEDVHGRGLFDVPAGRVLWVDAIATSHEAAMRQLVALLPMKYGHRETVAGEVFSRAGELRMFPMKTLNRFFGGPAK
jgi:hypothetical protein